MIYSKKFVDNYLDNDGIGIKEIAEDMTRIGNEYNFAGPLIDINDLVIGEVVECEIHPDSDHLHICKIDVGSEILNIVCGAPNMRKGIKIIVAKAGTKLPGGVIKKSVILGVESNGMCCSLEELGIDKKFLDDNDIKGIHELSDDAPVGMDPIKYIGLDDSIIDFELTPNRSDLLSMLGMAYESAAIYGGKVKEPIPSFNKETDSFDSDITLEVDKEICSLFLLGRVKNVVVKESPSFIKNALISCGIRPINNVVDISNYVMLETGQPLHFYDADKVGSFIGVRRAHDKETLVTLDNVERLLSNEDIVIYNSEGALGLAGVMGGFSSEVTKDSKNILIESAIFNPSLIRKTSKKILRSEASSRFEKGLDPKRSYLALNRSKELLTKYANGRVSEYTHEFSNVNIKDKYITISLDKINSVLGMNLNIGEVIDVLERLSLNVDVNNDILKVTIPSRRLDLNIQEDLIEEVGRIYGVDNIEAKLPISNSKGHVDNYDRKIKTRLTDLGLNEVISYSLINSNNKSKFIKDDFDEIKVLDPLTKDRDMLRGGLVSSLIDVYKYNKARNIKDVSIYEIGNIYKKCEGLYIENNRLAILMSGTYINGINTKIGIDFYYLKGIVENLLNYLGYQNRYDYSTNDLIIELHPYQSANILINGENIGFIGKVNPIIIKDNLYVCEIDLDSLKLIKTGKIKYKEVSKYPSMKKDVSFIFNNFVKSKDIVSDIKKSSSKLLKSVYCYDEYINNNERSLTFELTFLDENRTLTDEEVLKEFNNIIDSITKKYAAKVKNK